MSRIDGSDRFYEDTHKMEACIDRHRGKACFRHLDRASKDTVDSFQR